MKPAVITSKPAEKHYNNIVAQHGDILQGLAMQSQKVAQFNTQRQAELANQNAMNAEMDKAKMVANTTQQKNSMDFAAKQADLDIKRASLSAV